MQKRQGAIRQILGRRESSSWRSGPVKKRINPRIGSLEGMIRSGK